MIKVVILVSDHCLLSGVAGPMDMFLQAGVVWNSILAQRPTPYFDVRIATLDGNPVSAYNEMPVVPHCSIEAVEEVDLIVVPSQGFHFEQDEAFHQRVKYLIHWYERGADLASICTGAFTLAATGLLDGKTATTHWGAAQAFRKIYPAVDLQINKMVTDEGRLFCGGGITADLNLSLYLISKYCGREVALQCSRCTLVDLDRITQLPFAVFLSDKNHQDSEILDAQEWIENNYPQNISVDSLAETGSMSKRNFNRRFKSATGESVVTYIQQIRVEAAKKLLEKGPSSFEDISVNIGYENVSFFRRVFKRTTGLSPTAYRKKFNLFF
jgi:transcriptional regulator GlxA family with amidase domain